MADLQSTFRLLLLVLLSSFGVQGSTDEINQCKDAGGECIPSSDTCDHQGQFLGCNDDQICCLPPPWIQTRRVDPCSDVPVPRDCKKLYKGICETECHEKRIHVMDCNEDCKCCGCKIKNKCKKNFGYCIKKSQECEGLTKNKWCKGKKCTCCIPDCPETDECTRVRGRCDKTCNDGEESHSDARCNTENNSECKCCVRTVDPCDVQTRECSSINGKCRDRCYDNERSYFGRCLIDDCVCCVRNIIDPVCETTNECRLSGGSCQPGCRSTVKIPNINTCQSSCTCCKDVVFPQTEGPSPLKDEDDN